MPLAPCVVIYMLLGLLLFTVWHFCLQAQLIAQSIGQAFSVAYQEFLRANGINPEDLSQKEYSDIINTQEMYNDDLIHFSNSENCKEVGIPQKEELGINSERLCMWDESHWRCRAIREMYYYSCC